MPMSDPRIPTTAEMDEHERKSLDCGVPSAFAPVEPWHTHVGMSDQEIRARALECAVRLLQSRNPLTKDAPLELAREFETYISKGEKP